MTTTVAFLGLGGMGLPMAANLVTAGFRVRAWNRSVARLEGLTGAEPCRTPHEAAEGSAFVISMVADGMAAEAVSFGPKGLLGALAPDAVHIGMSTVSLAATRRLVSAHADQGREYVAAPVFGRPEAAAARKLWIVVGGDPDPVARAEPVFAALGQGTYRFPTAEQATLAKLAGNFLIGATVEALSEALVLVEKGGLDPEQFLAMLTGTLFDLPLVRNYGARIARTEFTPAGFSIPLARKDFTLIRAASEEFEAPLPIAELVGDRLEEAARRGRRHYDLAGLASVVREEAGLPERRETAP